MITIIEMVRPRKAKFAFRYYLNSHVLENAALFERNTYHDRHLWEVATCSAGTIATIIMYTNDERAAEDMRSALAMAT